MTVVADRRAVLGAVLAAGAAWLSAPARATIPSPRDGRVVALAQRIAGLLREREANEGALGAAADRFALPPTPAELVVTYRGPLGPLKVEVEADWIRDQLANLSPRSKQGRKLRRLLRIHEQHYARMYADREASGLGALIRERERIERELEAAATEARGLEGHSAAHTALQAAALISTRDGLRDAPHGHPGPRGGRRRGVGSPDCASAKGGFRAAL
jgi:hypothetical protein